MPETAAAWRRFKFELRTWMISVLIGRIVRLIPFDHPDSRTAYQGLAKIASCRFDYEDMPE